LVATQVPSPSPATLHAPPLPAELLAADGALVSVDGRGAASADPSRLSIDGGRWSAVAAWSGPWPADERWWDGTAHRRRARCQVVTADGDAHLMVLEEGRWRVEATYD
jgi:protein ImuB